jgi:hypothetical protein
MAVAVIVTKLSDALRNNELFVDEKPFFLTQW